MQDWRVKDKKWPRDEAAVERARARLNYDRLMNAEMHESRADFEAKYPGRLYDPLNDPVDLDQEVVAINGKPRPEPKEESDLDQLLYGLLVCAVLWPLVAYLFSDSPRDWWHIVTFGVG